MIFDSVALSPGCGTNAKRTGGSGEPSILANQTSLEIDHKLQKALCIAIEQVGMLWRFNRDLKQSAQIPADIRAGARWINFLIDQREYIAVEITEQRPDLVELGGQVVCETCRKGAKDGYRKTSSHESSAPPIWKKQLEFLLACTKRVGLELFEQECASFNPRRSPGCLAELMRALLRQRRCLLSIGAGETSIAVEHRANSCAECGQSINPPQAAAL